MSTDLRAELGAAIDRLSLVDHHVHGATRADVDRATFEGSITESDRSMPSWMTQFDSQIGFAIRRWCAPLLDLPVHAAADHYLDRRTELGFAEVNGRLLRASGIGHYLLETGYRGGHILGLDEMARVGSAVVDEIVRLESVAESLAVSGISAAEFFLGFPTALADRTAKAVGLKSVVAYRHGFDFDPARPTQIEVTAAAGRWLSVLAKTGSPRLDDPVLLRFLLWTGVDTGLPIQLHTGYGDPDLRLDRCDPLLLTPWIKLVEPFGTNLLLLHCYPYQRQAGYLAQVFPQVYFDVGLGVNYTGSRSDAVVAESLELAPFSKILFSSDAWGPPELHFLGAHLWRRGMKSALGGWVEAGDWSLPDAVRVAGMIGVDNARRAYQLPLDSARPVSTDRVASR